MLRRIAGFLQRPPRQALRDPIIEEDVRFSQLLAKCRPFTMTSKERMFSLYGCVEYVVRAGIPGDFVECGVWRGGSAMLIAHTLLALGIHDRRICLYDTFEGMSAPSELDKDFRGQDAQSMLDAGTDQKEKVWCVADLADVQRNMGTTGYPSPLVTYWKGKVEDTIPRSAPDRIALLRLDTDWYESTKHELTYLYPRLEAGGVLIIDDYGHWQGCRRAVDEYFAEDPILLSRIDYTGRVGIKTGPREKT